MRIFSETHSNSGFLQFLCLDLEVPLICMLYKFLLYYVSNFAQILGILELSFQYLIALN